MASTASDLRDGATAPGIRLAFRKIAEALHQFRHLPRALAIARAAAGWRCGAWLGLVLLQGLLPLALVALARPAVDSLTSVAGSGNETALLELAAFAAAIVGLLLLTAAIEALAEYLRADQARRIEDHVAEVIQEKSSAVDLEFFDAPDFHDHLHRAREEARYRPVALLQSVGAVAQHGLTLLGMAALLAPYAAWASIALVASTLPALAVVLRFAAAEHLLNLSITPAERRSTYLDELLTKGEHAAEVRLFGLGQGLRRAFADLRRGMRRKWLDLARRRLLAEIGADVVALTIAGGCVAWMAWRAVQGEVSLGDVVLFYLAFSQGQRLARSLLAGMGDVYYNVLFLENLFAFLDQPPRLRQPARPSTLPAVATGPAVRFRGVTFRYPGSDSPVLRGFDLAVEPSSVVAIVGPNGAGKSSLVKLLCRFYDPDSGSVELAGADLRTLATEDLRAAMSVMFQQPVRYQESVAENVLLGASAGRLPEALRGADASELVSRLPLKEHTILGKAFGGVELSVGQMQRIALARALARPAPLLVFDEPTSAMDSWSEARWMARLRAFCAGRTVIVITHRFTTAMQADVIHVVEDGCVVESGTHEQLVDGSGRYAESWAAQRRAP